MLLTQAKPEPVSITELTRYGLEQWVKRISMPPEIKAKFIEAVLTLLDYRFKNYATPKIFRLMIGGSGPDQRWHHVDIEYLAKKEPALNAYVEKIREHSFTTIDLLPYQGIVSLDRIGKPSEAEFYDMFSGNIPNVSTFKYSPETNAGLKVIFHTETFKYRPVKKGEEAGRYGKTTESGAAFTRHKPSNDATIDSEEFCSLGHSLAGLAPAIIVAPGHEKIIRLKLVNTLEHEGPGIIGCTNGMPSGTKGYYLNDGVGSSKAFAGPYQLIRIPTGARFAQDSYTDVALLGKAGDFIVHDIESGRSTIVTQKMLEEKGFLAYNCNDEGKPVTPSRPLNTKFQLSAA